MITSETAFNTFWAKYFVKRAGMARPLKKFAYKQQVVSLSGSR